MNQLEQIGEISTVGNGVLRTSEVISKRISKTTLAKFVEKYNYERISHGIYCSPDVWKDGLYLLQLRCPKTIFSHDTALFLLDMTDQEPLQYTVTVKSGYNATHLREDGVKVFSIKKDFFELGISKAKTPFGNEVFIYNPERTVCDRIRSRSQIEIQIFQDAMKQYIRVCFFDIKNFPLFWIKFLYVKINKIIRQQSGQEKIETLLVIDSTTGQNGLEQARVFNEIVELTGIILTKFDGTAKGGIIFPISEELQKPIKFIGVGEGIEDLKEFNVKEFVEAMFD